MFGEPVRPQACREPGRRIRAGNFLAARDTHNAMNEAYVLLNVSYKSQQDVVEKATRIPVVKSVKTVYGICDVLVILESDDMQKIKDAIDNDLHGMDGITNLTSLISVN